MTGLDPALLVVIGTFAILVAVERARRDLTRRLDDARWEPRRRDESLENVRREAAVRAEDHARDIAERCAVDARQQAEIDEVRKALEEMKERSAYR